MSSLNSVNGILETAKGAFWEIASSPVNIGLSVLCLYLLKKLLSPAPAIHPSQSVTRRPPPEPRNYTLKELIEFDGRDEEKPLLMAIDGNVFDVSNGRAFYGPGGPYHIFAGHDASRALAKVSTDPVDVKPLVDGPDPLDSLTDEEMTSLREWERSLSYKYPRVGRLVPGDGLPDEEPSGESTSTAHPR